MGEFVLTSSCPNRTGIVAATTGLLATLGCVIKNSQDFEDELSDRFFMRTRFQTGFLSQRELTRAFAETGDRFAMNWAIHDLAIRPKLVIMVSEPLHCLRDLLNRYEGGALPVEIPAIISNCGDAEYLAARHSIPFHFLPVSNANRDKQERRVEEIIDGCRCDLIVLARYMKILSPQLAVTLAGRAINIHNSFLPSFKGLNPYHQAYKRGVKMIGATAHYIIPELDDGPIIEQGAIGVDHTMSVIELEEHGAEVECVVLGRAVKAHIEHRVLQNGNRTVVFR
jgi:formyltetrahydrofolate deformylase